MDRERHRLDRWLWFARFYKSRGLATDAVSGGRVKVNGERVKPAHDLRVGDRLAISRDEQLIEIEVLAFPARRGPAPEAQASYAETAESAARRAAQREQRRLADLTRPRPDTRPDKRDRRLLDRLRREQG